MSVQSDRVNKLKRVLEENSDALFITNEQDIYYFSGFQKSEGAMIITGEEAYLLVDFRYYEAACQKARDCRVICFKVLTDTARTLLKDNKINRLFIQSAYVTLSYYSKLLRAFNECGISVVSDDTLNMAVSNLRMVKSREEIDFISRAQKITEKAYNEILNYIKPGVKEREICVELEYLMKRYGAEDVSFDLITITGKKTSLPHGVPGEEVIASGDFFTMDIGALYNGYHSDMTRTVAVKSYDDEQKNIYDTVLKSQLAALESVKAGVKACEVDKTARDIISSSGYVHCFGHSTGHGVGLDIHERPNISPNGEAILSENMVITVEPGIYVENRFGVRIEDMILIKNDGYKSFTAIPKELIVV